MLIVLPGPFNYPIVPNSQLLFDVAAPNQITNFSFEIPYGIYFISGVVVGGGGGGSSAANGRGGGGGGLCWANKMPVNKGDIISVVVGGLS